MRLTSLEDTLSMDTCGSARDHAMAMLQVEQARLRVLLNQPNTPDDYRTLTNRLSACEAAVMIIVTLWRRYHGVQW